MQVDMAKEEVENLVENDNLNNAEGEDEDAKEVGRNRRDDG